LLLCAIFTALPSIHSAQAQEISRAEWIDDSVRFIDGDSILVDDQLLRLFGIDAPELGQLCYVDRLARACGEKSANYLADMVYGKKVRCRVEARDGFNRTLSACIWNGRNINEIMVLTGNAVAWSEGLEECR
jgi:endonuclease YncB( thermonuclease family)